MTRRHLIITLSAGLLAYSAPACSLFRANVTQTHDLPAPPRPAVAEALQPATQVVSREVPTPGPPAPTPSPEAQPTEPRIERTHFPTLPEKPDAVRQPAPLPEPPGPTRERAQAEPLPLTVPAPEAPKPEEAPLLAALRCFLNDHPAEALALLEHYDKANQDLLLVLLPLATRLSQAKLQQLQEQEVVALLRQLDTALVPLRSCAALSIEKMCFCRSISKFGVYEPLPDNHAFRPGEPVQVYVEIENFASEAQGQQFVTKLASSVEICEYGGRVVCPLDFPAEEYTDLCRTQRHDYFSNYRLFIPENLAPGAYTLRIRVTDTLTKRTVERTLDFRVTAVAARAS